MTDKDKARRSIRAIAFLKSDFWVNDLQPYIEKEKRRLEREYMDYQMIPKFDKDRERAKRRHTACDIIPGVVNIWSKERNEIKKNKELKIADNAIQGVR